MSGSTGACGWSHCDWRESQNSVPATAIDGRLSQDV
jgi:hypothetical protein